MRRHGLHRYLYIALTVLHWSALIASAMVAASLKADKSVWEPLQGLLKSLHNSAWITIPLLIFTWKLAEAVRTAIGPPWVWDIVHNLLDRFRDHVFGSQGDPSHHHRVTLFKHVSLRLRLCRWPLSGWLVPVERSGYTTQKSRTAFLAPDDADRAEGIAGQTWMRNGVVIVNGLPDINDNPPQRCVEAYADKTFVNPEWLKKHKQHARSYCGIPVEVKGKLWGVIVLDSTNLEVIDDDDAIRVYRLIGGFLGKLLERAK